MSTDRLRRAARFKVPEQMPELQDKILMMLMADRADDEGRFIVADNEAFTAELAAETNAVMGRLRGDLFIRAGIDNARVTRVIEALKDATE